MELHSETKISWEDWFTVAAGRNIFNSALMQEQKLMHVGEVWILKLAEEALQKVA